MANPIADSAAATVGTNEANDGPIIFSKRMARLRRTARKSVPGGPYRVVGSQMPEQVCNPTTGRWQVGGSL
ncbi:hypothetical protein AgCh_038499 [Apium graveolens]